MATEQQQQRPRFAYETGAATFFTASSAEGYVQSEGLLEKKGAGKSVFGRRNWTARYAVLADSLLQYWKSERDYRQDKPPQKAASLDITDCVVNVEDGQDRDFKWRLSLTPGRGDCWPGDEDAAGEGEG